MAMNDPKRADKTDANRDPITGEPGAHPVGTGLGAAGAGAAAGAAGGAIAGPAGVVVGAVAGGVVGGLAGKAAGEAVNPTAEDEYWRRNYKDRPYAEPTSTYDDYAPAYKLGWESCSRRMPEGKSFDKVEGDLGRDWDKVKGSSRLSWDRAKSATRDAWDRVERKFRHDSPGRC
jgi:hypothetical protein